MAKVAKDESYWKNPDGSVNEDGHNLAEVFASKNRNFVKPLNPEGFCTICLDTDAKPPVARKLTLVASTTIKKLEIWVCSNCDGDAHDIAGRQAT